MPLGRALHLAGAILVATSIATAEPQLPASAPTDHRAAVAAHFAAETQTVRNAISAVDKKLRDGDIVRARRLAAMARILRRPPLREASPDEQMATARRAAAAKMLLHRDANERRLLLAELSQLRTDASRIAITTLHASTVPLPSRISRPARGPIARRFGDYTHPSSKVTLSQRGIDFEVQPRAAVVAPADGVVRFVGGIRGFDQSVIIDHGQFLSVVARLGDVRVPVGARVAEGDPVGSAVDRHVYLEIRVKLGPGGLPIDPEPVLAGSSGR